MSIHVCGQTLVLLDNDATVTEVNQKLVKATLKYIFYHIPEDRTFCFNTYEHDITLEETYTADPNDLVCSVDTMEFTPKDQNLTDTLAEVITRWKEADFACRDILVFTDGIEGEATGHEKEELNYLIETSEYPIYVVLLNQENNAQAKKGLLSVAVPSGGKLFESEFPGSDAGIDRQLAEMIYSAMDGYAAINWGRYEEPDEEDAAEKDMAAPAEEDMAASAEEETGTQTEPDVTETAEEEEYMAEPFQESRVIYEYDAPSGLFDAAGSLILAAALIVAGIVVAVLGGFVIMKKKRAGGSVSKSEEAYEEEFFDDYELKGIGTVELAKDMTYSEPFDNSSSATRLLGGRMLTLSDRNNAAGNYRIMLSAPMSAGRGNCDVVISGDDAVSKRHCEFYESEGRVYVRDLSSANGTKVNGVKISETELSDGDELLIGTTTFTVRLL